MTDRSSRIDALAGVRVLEHAQMVSGPHCAKMLADLGAEVVKIEPPSRGDQARAAGPFPDGAPHPERSGLFLYLNANKRSVTLDPATPAGQRLFADLVDWCDILVESPPGQRLGDLGLGYETLAARRPELVMVSITPFGDTGPSRGYASSELVTFHASGLGYVTPRGATDPAKPPLKAGGRLAEFFAGLNGAVAAMAALHARRRTGRGQHVDVSKQECLLPMLRRDIAAYTYDGEVASRLMRSWKIAPNDIVPCKDGYVFIAAVEEAQWQRLVDLMGKARLGRRPTLPGSSGPGRALGDSQVTGRDVDPRALQDGDLPNGPGQPDPDQPGEHQRPTCLTSPHLAAREFFVEVEHPDAGRWPYPGAPYRFAATPWRIRRRAPRLGEHNDEVYGEWLGRSGGELDTLRRTGVI